IADGMVTTNFLGIVTDKVKDRTLTVEEEDARLEIFPVLSLLSVRYETPLEMFKRGVHSAYWQTNQFWISPRPQQMPIRFAAHSVQALGLSGRPEAIEV